MKVEIFFGLLVCMHAAVYINCNKHLTTRGSYSDTDVLVSIIVNLKAFCYLFSYPTGFGITNETHPYFEIDLEIVWFYKLLNIIYLSTLHFILLI